ncbi:MAG: hypothetical protein Q8P88_00860 [Candidatus Jorgensenbacteria bacterium]|nr:hypothetical protein [Candidatus Jorgensenbacteria bacterium]
MHESWQWFYVFLIVSTLPPLISAIVMDLQRNGTPVYQMPVWLYVPGALGLLMLVTPYGWLTLWALLVPFWNLAPLAPALFGTAFAVGAWVLSFAAILDLPRLWRTMSPRT